MGWVWVVAIGLLAVLLVAISELVQHTGRLEKLELDVVELRRALREGRAPDRDSGE